MLKLTSHLLRRSKERELDLNLIAEKVLGSRLTSRQKRIKIPDDNATVVAKREGRDLVVITGWKNENNTGREKSATPP